MEFTQPLRGKFALLNVLVSFAIFVGLAGGSFPLIATLYVTESVEADMRGTFGIFMNVMMTSGMLFVNGVGSLVHWVTLTGILIAFPCRYCLIHIKCGMLSIRVCRYFSQL